MCSDNRKSFALKKREADLVEIVCTSHGDL